MSPLPRPALGPVIGSIVALLASLGLFVMGNALLSTLVPVRAQTEGFSALELGGLGSAYYVGFVLGCLGGPYVIQRAGHIRSFTAAVSLAAAASLAYALVVSPAAWLAFRCATGICLAVLYLIIESWLNDRAPNEQRGVIMSIYIVINYGVTVVGQFMLTLDEPTSFTLFSAASILLSVAVLPLSMTRSEQPAPVNLVRFRPRHLFRLSPAGFVGVFMIGLGTGSLWSLGPVFARTSGLSVDATATFMSLAVAGGALMQWPMGKLSDIVDRRFILIGVVVASMVFALALATLAGGTIPLMLATGALFGASLLPGYAIAAAHAYDHAGRGELVEVSAGLLLLNGLGAAIGPFVASIAMREVGPGGLFYFIAAVQLVHAAFLVARLSMRAAPSGAAKDEFDLATTAPVGAGSKGERFAAPAPPEATGS